jgi:hypothetical protein
MNRERKREREREKTKGICNSRLIHQKFLLIVGEKQEAAER